MAVFAIFPIKVLTIVNKYDIIQIYLIKGKQINEYKSRNPLGN